MSDRRRRVVVAPGAHPGDLVSLDADEAHHVARVLRLREGETVEAFDGAGHAWTATIESAAREELRLRIGSELAAATEPPVAVTLVQAFVRPEKLEYVLQKGTEIGVARFVLVPTARAEAPAPSPSRLARYRRIVTEACKQSGRVVVPAVEVGGFPPEPVEASFALHGGASTTLGAALRGPRRERIALAIGPEGGFEESEIEALAARGWIPAGLGPRTLRTETAGAVAAAIVLNAWGDLAGV